MPNKGPIRRPTMEDEMDVLGIDVGLTGALVLTRGDAIRAWWDMPTLKSGKTKKLVLDVVELARIMHSLRAVDVVVLEEQGAAPGQGLGSTFKLGWQAGVIEGLARGNGMFVQLVRPQVWKAAMRLGSDKAMSRRAAQALFPVTGAKLFDRVKDHGRAEAALIAAYWRLAHARDAA
jgi:hypothetical protein